jgi:hypothetical protein
MLFCPKSLSSALSAIFASALLSLPGSATADSGCLLKAMRRLANVAYDSSAELELLLTPEVMRVITTSDGKLGPALDGNPAPKWLKDWMARKRIKIPPEKVAWDDLSFDQQHKLLQYSAQRRGVEFYDDRAIHGMVVRKAYRRSLMQKVEYGAVTMVENVEGVELHFRRRMPAGDVVCAAWKFEEGIGMQRTHLHVHMVAKLRPQRLQSKLGLARQVDFIARTNLAAEMVSILEQGERINRKQDKISIVFDSYSKQRMREMTQYFERLGNGHADAIGDEFKDGWVAIRGPDAYDEPGLWGLEYRVIDRKDNQEIIKEVLNGIQESMISENYGISDASLAKWLGQRDPSDAIHSSWYNGTWDEVFQQLPRELADSRSWLKEYLKWDEYRENHGLKMIFHDWSRSPLYFHRPKAFERILERQKAAIAELKEGIGPDEVLRRFLLSSGLYEDVLGSVGVKVSDVKRALDRNTWEDLEELDGPDDF